MKNNVDFDILRTLVSKQYGTKSGMIQIALFGIFIMS